MGPLKLVGPGTCRLGSGLCLPPASQPLLWRREPGGEGGGRSQWLEERSPGIRMPNEERGAIGDTEILIRGSL